MPLKITTPPLKIRCTSKQYIWSKEYENQISLNKVNQNFRFEKKKTKLKMRKKKNTKIQGDGEYIKNLKNSN